MYKIIKLKEFTLDMVKANCNKNRMSNNESSKKKVLLEGVDFTMDIENCTIFAIDEYSKIPFVKVTLDSTRLCINRRDEYFIFKVIA